MYSIFFDEDVKKSLDYLAKLSAELENAKSGNANFWRNVFCSLETPFERMMMAEGIAKLLEFVGELDISGNDINDEHS